MSKEEKFLRDMIAHHQMAVDMSTKVKADLEHDEVKKFAQRVIDVQSAEIEEMQEWLDEWYPEDASADDSNAKKKKKMKMESDADQAAIDALPHNKALDNHPLFAKRVAV